MKNIKYLLFIFTLFSSFMILNNVNAETITDYQTNYYWCITDDTTSDCTSTGFRSGTSNKVTLVGYSNNNSTWESFTGLYNKINYSLKKGVTYLVSFKIHFTGLYYDEFGSSNLSRFANENYYKFDKGYIQSASTSYYSYNDPDDMEDTIEVTATINYTINPTQDTDVFHIGAYSTNGDTFGVNYHWSSVVTATTEISITANADDTIINQNQTIIDQNQTIIDQNQQTNDKIDDVNDSVNDLNDSINDSDISGAEDSASSFFDNFESNDFGLSDIISIPLNTINQITSNSCTELTLNIPFVNKTLTLPCMTTIYEEFFGSFLTIYQTITFGIVAYWVCIQIYAMVKGFKDPSKDEIEVLDL